MADPIRATKDAVLMIEPRPCLRICFNAACEHRYTEVRLISCTFRQTSIPVSVMEASSVGDTPALLKAASTLPKVAAAVSKRFSTAAGSVTSVATNSPPTASAAAAPASAFVSAMTTWAPSEASRLAVASPIPLAPPVTTAVRPGSRRQMIAESSWVEAVCRAFMSLVSFAGRRW